MIRAPIRAEALTGQSFTPFGQVIEATGSSAGANQGRAERFDTSFDLACTDPRAPRLHTAIYRIRESVLPFELKLVERHPLSPQLFFPNSGRRFLVCACSTLADGEPDLAALCAFVGQRNQGIVWRAGVWHSPFAALDEDGDFLMQQWQGAGHLDCEERPLPQSIMIDAGNP